MAVSIRTTLSALQMVEDAMTAKKTKRGRPAGTGIDDMPVLRAIAEKIASKPKLKATTAFKSICNDWVEKDIRRIQIKWKVHGERLLAEVRARRAAARKPTVADRELTAMKIASAAVRANEELRKHQKMIDAMVNSPAARAVRELAESPAMRMARDLYDSPAMRMARELHDSPSMRLMRQLQMSKEWPYNF
jgi:hypothetical protein